MLALRAPLQQQAVLIATSCSRRVCKQLKLIGTHAKWPGAARAAAACAVRPAVHLR